MSITSMNARMGMAEKLSIPQLTKAVQDGTVPSFIGIPLIQQKMKEQQGAASMQPQQPPVAQQVLQQAQAMQGVPALPSNMPEEYAQGGILSYAGGGVYEDDDEYDPEDEAQSQALMEGEALMDEIAANPEIYSGKNMGVDYSEAPNPQVEYHRTPSTEAVKVSKGKPGEFESMAIARGKAHGVDEHLIKHVMHKETGGLKDRANAVSPAGAIGVMQLMPATARGLGVENPYDPAQNIEGGVKYLGQLQRKYQDPKLAAIAYNWGPGNTDKWLASGADPSRLPRETRGYIENLAEGGITGLAGGGAIHFQNRGIVGPSADPDTMNQIDILGRELDEERARFKGMKLPGQRQIQADPSILEKYNASRDRMNALQQGYENLMGSSGMNQPAFGQYRGALGSQPPKANPMVQAMSAQPAAPVAPPATTSAKPYDFTQFDAATDRYMKEREQAKTPSTSAVPFAGTETPDLVSGAYGASTLQAETPATQAAPKEQAAQANPMSGIEELLNKREAGLGRQRDIDNYMSLLSAGLGMMGGTSPFAAANIGQGAQAGIKTYGDAAARQAAAENAILSGRLGMYKYGNAKAQADAMMQLRKDIQGQQLGFNREKLTQSGEEHKAALQFKREKEMADQLEHMEKTAMSERLAKMKDTIATPEQKAQLEAQALSDLRSQPWYRDLHKQVRKYDPMMFNGEAKASPNTSLFNQANAILGIK